MPNISKAICSGSVPAASWRSSIAWRRARFSVSIQVRWPPASMSRTGPGLSSNSAAPPIMGQPPGSSADSVQSSQFTNIARSRGRPRGFLIAGWNTTSVNSTWPCASTASSSSSRDPKCAKRPDFDMPVASASVPMVRPSSPALLTSRKASSRMAARVRSPFVWTLLPFAALVTLTAAQNSTNVRICQDVAQLGGALLRHERVAAASDELAVGGAVIVPAALRALQQPPLMIVCLAPCQHVSLVQLEIVVRVDVVEGPRRRGDPDEEDASEPKHRWCRSRKGAEGQELANPGAERGAWHRGRGEAASREPPATSPRRLPTP